MFCILENLLTKQSFTFLTIKQLYNDLKEKYHIGNYSLSTLYRVVKNGGLEYKKITTHKVETDEIKLARIHFYNKYVNSVDNCENKC